MLTSAEPRVRQLLADGLSPAQAARLVGVTRGRAYQISKRMRAEGLAVVDGRHQPRRRLEPWEREAEELLAAKIRSRALLLAQVKALRSLGVTPRRISRILEVPKWDVYRLLSRPLHLREPHAERP